MTVNPISLTCMTKPPSRSQLLCGRSNKPHYRSCTFVRSFVYPFIRLSVLRHTSSCNTAIRSMRSLGSGQLHNKATYSLPLIIYCETDNNSLMLYRPVAPVGPVNPVDPVGPRSPRGPVNPLEPVTPVDPTGPIQHHAHARTHTWK